MTQLTLNIVPRLPYGPENFVLHRGVREVVSACIETIEAPHYSIHWIEGPARSGKTHLSVRLVDEALARHKYPKLIEGESFGSFLSNGFFKSELSDDQVFVIDEADRYFRSMQPGDSGEFVNFVENLRMQNGHLLLLSTDRLGSFPCDGHIMSRLKAGLISLIGAPEEADMPELVFQMARQRGLSLTKARIDYVAKRVRRDTAYLESYLDRVTHLSAVLSKRVTRPILSNAL